jgi:hypothetical protein
MRLEGSKHPLSPTISCKSEREKDNCLMCTGDFGEGENTSLQQRTHTPRGKTAGRAGAAPIEGGERRRWWRSGWWGRKRRRSPPAPCAAASSSLVRPPWPLPLPPLRMRSRREEMQFWLSSLLGRNLPCVFASSVGRDPSREQ